MSLDKKLLYPIFLTILYLLLVKGKKLFFTFILTRDYFLELDSETIYLIIFSLDSIIYFILIALAYFLLKKINVKNDRKTKISLRVIFEVILVVVLFRLFEDPISRSNIIFGSDKIPEIVNQESKGLFEFATVIFSTIILAPIFEELFFRKIFLGFFNSKNIIVGIIITSLLFTSIHFDNSQTNVSSLVINFLFGVLAAIIYLNKGLFIL